MNRGPSALACLAMLVFGLVARAAPTLPLATDPPIERASQPAELERGAIVPGSIAPAPQRRFLPGPYLAEAIRIIDGDTFETRVSIWLGLEIVTKIRLAGIDAPEMRGKCPEEKRRALEARDMLARLLEQAPIRIVDVRPDKYNGRVVARALDRDNRDISQAMLAAGQAVAYDGGHKTGFCELAGRLTASR